MKSLLFRQSSAAFFVIVGMVNISLGVDPIVVTSFDAEQYVNSVSAETDYDSSGDTLQIIALAEVANISETDFHTVELDVDIYDGQGRVGGGLDTEILIEPSGTRSLYVNCDHVVRSPIEIEHFANVELRRTSGEDPVHVAYDWFTWYYSS